MPPDRCPGASRVRGYEPRPRAPPLPPFQQRPAGTPLGGEGERNISLLKNRVKLYCLASGLSLAFLGIDIMPFEPGRSHLMYASNLQELLFHCCEHSDMSPQVFMEFTERFNTLRSYGHLPRGRDQRKQLLTPTQIAAAILGLVPMRPSWAGHGATVLKTLSPVGGPSVGFYNANSLIEAMALLLTNADARESLIGVRIILGETGTNSSGGAAFTYESQAFGDKHSSCRIWRFRR